MQSFVKAKVTLNRMYAGAAYCRQGVLFCYAGKMNRGILINCTFKLDIIRAILRVV